MCITSPGKIGYDWKGNREEDSEAMVLFKTSNEKAEELRNHIEGSHPNQLPAILQLEADAGAAYEEWARQQTSSLINEQAEDETVGSSTNHITDIFGGQARQVNVEETDLSEAEAIAYIKELMEGMDELDDIETSSESSPQTAPGASSEEPAKRGWFSSRRKK